jgi:hypothetical protein
LETPEGAALPVAGWLRDHGHAEAAAGLVEEILPLASRLRFTPKPHRAATPPTDPGLVYLDTARDVRGALAARRPNLQVEAMRETLTIWHPFGDELLTWWLDADLTGTSPAAPIDEAKLAPLLNGLDAILNGARFNADGRVGDGRQLLGWTTGGHWLR